MLRFRPPWWVREWIKSKLKITKEDADRKRRYLSIAYAITAMMAFNLVVYEARSPGVITEEEEKNLSAAEKVLLAMKPNSNARVVKYKVGEGVISDTTYTAGEVQASYEEKMEARRQYKVKTQQNSEINIERQYE